MHLRFAWSADTEEIAQTYIFYENIWCEILVSCLETSLFGIVTWKQKTQCRSYRSMQTHTLLFVTVVD